MKTSEASLRSRLGIPPDARRVIVFGESSHWDPNWLFTSREYYQIRIQKVLDRALDELEAEPGRVFGIESLFFLVQYWQHRPEQRRRLQALVDSGRLRLLGSGLTSPDATLPATEALLRDYLLGQQWLRLHGMAVEPRLAYLPDDFGLSPELPALLRELGMDRLGITRIDGMHFVGADYRRRSAFPLPGSSAELLERTHRSLDFVWQAGDGSEVLTHWNAFTYFQGDMLAHKGVMRWMGLTFGVPWRSAAHVARRIDRFAAQLEPLSRTPYLFCPIGCDFNDPIHGLKALLDRYNQQRYERTGTWVLSAGLDDYLGLVDCHRSRLPVLRLDPNPYWMGFYASRPEAKQRSKRITAKLLAAESRHCVNRNNGCRKLAEAWEMVAVSNHHDFITGTSPDRVWHFEQRPWLTRAEALADEALALAPPLVRGTAGLRPRPPGWSLSDGRLVVVNSHYRLVLDERAGGAIVSWRDAAGHELLAGPGNDPVSFRDSGGLWRLGHEYRGGSFRQRRLASQRRAALQVFEQDGRLVVRIETRLRFQPVVRWLWLEEDSPIVRLRLQGAAATRRAVCVRFPTRLQAADLTMDVLGGVVERPHAKLYQPTFWPARSFVHLRDERSDVGLAVVMGGPASLSSDGRGRLDLMALRNAHRERAFGLLPVMAHPATGRDEEEHHFDYAVWSTPAGDWLANRLPQLAREVRLGFSGWADSLAHVPVELDRDDVLVTAAKHAHRGAGIVVRLTRLGPAGPVVLRSPGSPILAAHRIDARERDLAALPVTAGKVEVDLKYSLTSLRLEF